MRISRLSRQSGENTEREVRRQRLVQYRDNWDLLARCHLREDMRSFSIDSITQIKLIVTPVREVLDTDNNAAMGTGCGIFGGASEGWATLTFTPERARWVAEEHWRPQQRGNTHANGSYVLETPYSDERELVVGSLRFGADIEVMAPPACAVVSCGRCMRRWEDAFEDF
jgi:predicted DNA-binding transcriptional regulator YafY